MPIAFKEWAVTVRALAEGEQLLTLRKGGAGGDDRFKLDHSKFFLYPASITSVLISFASRTSRSCAVPSRRVSGPTVSRPTSTCSTAASCSPSACAFRAWAEVTASFTISDPRAVDALSPFYVWTPAYAVRRLQWTPREPLHVLLLRAYRIPRPVTVRVKDEFGTRSWLEIQRDLPFEGTPVLCDDEFERAAAEIEAVCRGAAVPALA